MELNRNPGKEHTADTTNGRIQQMKHDGKEIMKLSEKDF